MHFGRVVMNRRARLTCINNATRLTVSQVDGETAEVVEGLVSPSNFEGASETGEAEFLLPSGLLGCT